MEWKNVRKWLLLMLLVVDLFLAGNLVRQVYDNRQTERQAVLDAVAVAARRGCSFLAAEGVAVLDKTDCMHLTRKGHAALAQKLAQLVPQLVNGNEE